MSMNAQSGSGPASSSGSGDTPKGHPKGLYILFSTEMWERFSYYGMRALLVLYLVDYLKWQPGAASSVYKWYTSLVYLTPLLGGFLADRYLGLRVSIIIGGVLMAIGHFLMAFEPLPFFYAALTFLILGNGFFKPNISTLVGKMYGANDQRRDSAFTIFYMGINLGAFLSPLVCGWLRVNYGFHYGFAAAGVGMVIGLVNFLIGQKAVMHDVALAGNTTGGLSARKASDRPLTPAVGRPAQEPDPSELEPRVTGLSGIVSSLLPPIMLAAGVVLPGLYLWKYFDGQVEWLDLLMPGAFGAIFVWMGLTLFRIRGAARDKSSVIFYLFAFSVLFWMAFEQAGNALNLWAEYNTDLHLGSWKYPAEYFQSVNPLLIVGLGPLFAIFWVFLDRRGKGISTPAKMFVSLVFMGLSFGAMVVGAAAENNTVTKVSLAEVPASVKLDEVHAGRISYDAGTKELSVRGVFPPFARTEALAMTVDPEYKKSVEALEKAASDAAEARPVSGRIGPLPAGFEFPLAGEKGKDLVSAWDPNTGSITLVGKIGPEVKADLLGAGAPPAWRNALVELGEKSQAARVSGLWLFLSYLFATIGELCLSPVGLSMVTKLAPARYASLFMGVWLLSSSVAQYVGGSLGEMWDQVTPGDYFTIFVKTSIIGAGVLAMLVIPLRKMMHKVT